MPKVKVYALSTCPWCMKTKKFLSDRDVSYECVEYDLADAQQQKAIMEEMRNRGGGNSFPLVTIGDKAVEGFNPEMLCEYLGIEE